MNPKPVSSVARKLAAALWLMAIGAAPAQTGLPLWANRYDGPGNVNDRASGIAVDGSGNVFVTGDSGGDYATIKYSSAGVPLWTNRYHATQYSHDYPGAMVVDGSGNVFVTGSSGGDYATIKYSGAGVPLWTNRYGGLVNGDDQANAIAVDGNGNVLVTGQSGGDYATIKYSGFGVPVWTNRYHGPTNGGDFATAVAVDGGGNVFVTGSSQGTGTSSYDYATIKYSSMGAPLWTNRYNGPGSSGDQATAIAVDGNGAVFVTGSSASSTYSSAYPFASDYATLAYSGAGMPLWTNRYHGPTNGADFATAVMVDGSGNVFVTGYSFDSRGHSFTTADYATVAYSGLGVPLWTNRYSGPGSNRNLATGMAVNDSGYVFVAGGTLGSGNSYDFATLAYSGSGVPLWTNRHNWPGTSSDSASAIAVDSSGNVFVTGYSYNGSNDDYVTIKYPSPIPLNYQIVGDQIVLSWANATFSLESAPTVQGTYTTVPDATSPHSTDLSGTERYFRLKGN